MAVAQVVPMGPAVVAIVGPLHVTIGIVACIVVG